MPNDTAHSRSLTLSSWLLALGLGLVIVLAACGGKDDTTSVDLIPTRTLVPPTATPTAPPVEVSPTPTDLPSASALEPVTTQIGSVLVIPSSAQSMINQTLADLVDRQHVNPQDVRLLSLEQFSWHDESMGCTSRYDDGYTQPIMTRGYRILFAVRSRIYAYHTDDHDTFFLCKDRAWLGLEGDPLPIDPVARSLVDLTRRDAATQFDVPQTQLTLASLIAVNWPDSSIGCPKAGGTYDERETPGYRIVFRMDGEPVIYHTSIRDYVRCLPDEEILPGMLRQAIPTPTPRPDTTS